MYKFFNIIILLCFVLPLSAQKYYYYKGERIDLDVSDSVVAYTYPIQSNDSIRPNLITKQMIHKDDAQTITKRQVLSKEYIVESHRMSNHFYVKLRSTTDHEALRQLAEETHVVLVGEVPYMNKWYDLMVANSLYDNSLDLSNYFYETGLFEDIDPGFVFAFRPSCVTDHSYLVQWALPMLNACQAWGITTGSSSITLAIVDMGVIAHTEFSPPIVDSYDCYTGDSPAQELYKGRDTIDGVPVDVYHGMNVAGVIFANHNYADIAGIAPNLSLINVSHPLNEDIDDNIGSNLASGISRAFHHGADIINCSWGDQGGTVTKIRCRILEAAIDSALTYGRNGKGCVVVFASGNKALESDYIDYPGRIFPDALVVGAVDEDTARAGYSAKGPELDVVAPGDHIYTTNNNSYIWNRGTSLAAPYVSGIAGLILSVNPNLSRKQVTDIIESTTAKVGSIQYYYTPARPNGTWNQHMGYGLVDAYAAVKEAQRRYFQNKIYPRDTSVVEYYPEIYAGYSVTDAIPYGDVIVKQGSNVTYKASEKILLLPGFQVENGASFLASIEPFANSTSAPSVIREEEGVNNEEALTTIQAESQDHFSIQPNPASDFITIICAEPIEQIMVYNLSGQLVMQTTESTFAVSAFSDGLYIVRTHMKDGSFYQAKFIKKQK